MPYDFSFFKPGTFFFGDIIGVMITKDRKTPCKWKEQCTNENDTD
jgi:hypothetical protein